MGRAIESAVAELNAAKKEVASDEQEVRDAEALLQQQLALFEVGKGSVNDILETYRDADRGDRWIGLDHRRLSRGMRFICSVKLWMIRSCRS